MIDWDAYRAVYDTLTYGDQVTFYEEVWQKYPVQKHYDSETCSKFLSTILRSEESCTGNIIEIGGWRGELAEEMLWKFPDIILWQNFEICRGAAESSVCKDYRYKAQTPEQWIWEMPITPGQILIASHVIEHMNSTQLRLLIDNIRPSAAFVASPLEENGQDWRGYNGSHVLLLGWKDVIALFEEYGLKHDPTFDTTEIRCFH